LTSGLALLAGPFLLVFLDRFVPLVAVILVLILLSGRMELLELLDRVRVALEHLSLDKVVSIVIRLVRRNGVIFPQRGTTESFTTSRIASSGFLAQTSVTRHALIASYFFLFLCSSNLKSIVE
jgi:hypothetical protein